MFKFIRYFIMLQSILLKQNVANRFAIGLIFPTQKWRSYPCFKAFWNDNSKVQRELEEKGEWFPKNRFDYALTNAKAYYAHRDMYGRKCKKFKGNCEECNAKHC